MPGDGGALIARIAFAQQILVNPNYIYPYSNWWQQMGPTVTATTNGGPLLFNWTMWLGDGNFGSPMMACRPSIDGDAAGRFEAPADLEDQWYTGKQQVQRTTVYLVPAGTYAFGIQCKASASNGTFGYTGQGTGLTKLNVIQLQ